MRLGCRECAGSTQGQDRRMQELVPVFGRDEGKQKSVVGRGRREMGWSRHLAEMGYTRNAWPRWGLECWLVLALDRDGRVWTHLLAEKGIGWTRCLNALLRRGWNEHVASSFCRDGGETDAPSQRFAEIGIRATRCLSVLPNGMPPISTFCREGPRLGLATQRSLESWMLLVWMVKFGWHWSRVPLKWLGWSWAVLFTLRVGLMHRRP